MAFSPLETLPTDCFNHICVHLEVGYLADLSSCSKSAASLCGGANGELWNLLLCQRLWAVDPATVLQLNTTANQIDWKEQYQTLVKAERDRQKYLDHLQHVDLHGWLERHFIGQLAPHVNGWEARY